VKHVLLCLLLGGCRATPVAAPEATPVALCRVVGAAVDPAGAPLAGVSVDGVGSEAIDERRSRTVGRSTARADAGGRFELQLPCGSDVVLEAAGQVWLNPPLQLRATPDAELLDMRLAPKMVARLSVVDEAGRAQPAVFESARDGSRTPIPVEGLVVSGMEPASPAGVLHVEGHPPRPWTFERSDVVDRDHEGRFEVTVVVGSTAARWLDVGKVHRDIKGAWCIDGGRRGDPCVLEPSAVRCVCEGPVALAGPWDVAWVVPLSGAETEVSPPTIEERCLPGDRARPAGIDAGLVLEASYAPGDCIDVVAGQPLEVRVDGIWR
jgi:hypothetical protein